MPPLLIYIYRRLFESSYFTLTSCHAAAHAYFKLTNAFGRTPPRFVYDSSTSRFISPLFLDAPGRYHYTATRTQMIASRRLFIIFTMMRAEYYIIVIVTTASKPRLKEHIGWYMRHSFKILKTRVHITFTFNLLHVICCFLKNTTSIRRCWCRRRPAATTIDISLFFYRAVASGLPQFPATKKKNIHALYFSYK